MIHLVVGLFKNPKNAGEAITALKDAKFTRDVSLIAKDGHSGQVRVYQVKEAPHDNELKDSELGAEVGFLGGVIGGLSAFLNPAFESLAVVAPMAVTMGIAGSAVGATLGGYIGATDTHGIPPQRALMYKDRIHAGEVFVAVSVKDNTQGDAVDIFNAFDASLIEVLENET